jgi:branched-chain amino acid transport system ATP-binding protein
MLIVDNLRVSRGGRPVLHGISLSVGADELVAIIGPNGAGKSTLLRTLSGLHRPTAGSIEFDGRRIENHSPLSIVGSGLVHVPEGRQLFPNLTVEENLYLGAFALKRTIEDARTAMARVCARFPEIANRQQQLAGSLSGGEQQILAIARGLMAQPRMLLIDEASLGLAPKLVHRIGEILESIRADGVAVLLVEQNVRLALRFAARAYICVAGRIALESARADLWDDALIASQYFGVGTERQ